MAEGSPPSELDEYRAQADRFDAALGEEWYLHEAGLKDELRLEPVYERFADLTTLETCRWLEEETGGTATRLAGPTELWRFACSGFLGRIQRENDERIAELESTLTATVDGDEVPFRELRPRIANEADRSRRRELDRARVEIVEQTNGARRDALDRLRDGVLELGATGVVDLHVRFGFAFEPLAAQCRSFLAETEDLHAETFARLLRARAGVELEDATWADGLRAMRAPEWDNAYRADLMLPALESTLAGMGIDLRSQRNIHLDVESRPTKSPRAFCSPLEVPGRVILVIKPMGGIDDWRAFFHEAGHAEHFAHVSPRLPFEARKLGDNAVTECWAFLLEHLVTDPAWLTRRLDVARPSELAADNAAVVLYYVRRYCAKLLYELDLHGGTPEDGLRERYAERMREATLVDFPEADYLADVDPGFYCTSYLRAWALEARIAAHLRERFGAAWFADRHAGSLVRELWSEGQGLDADTLLDQVAGERLELSAVGERIAEFA